MNTSILFLIFNRPDTTIKVFEAIRQARPTRLYIAADGPRSTRENEGLQCARAREIATGVDWPCEVKTLFRSENLGCRKAVSEAISWFFQQESEGIILEDDCLPDQSFFQYCEELLKKYRDEPQVMAIGGNCFFHDKRPAKIPRHSYYFSKHIEIWGWASWRRAWQQYDSQIKEWGARSKTNWLYEVGGKSREFEKYWSKTFNGVYNNKVDTWDSQWVFSVWNRDGLSILPTRNLVTNIGFNEQATHTKSGDGILDTLPLQHLDFPLDHPVSINPDAHMDKWLDSYIYGIGGSFKYKALKFLERVSKLIRR